MVGGSTYYPRTWRLRQSTRDVDRVQSFARARGEKVRAVSVKHEVHVLSGPRFQARVHTRQESDLVGHQVEELLVAHHFRDIYTSAHRLPGDASRLEPVS